VTGDLFGPSLGGDVLSVHQLRAPTVAGEADQVAGDERDGTPGAFLPRRVGGRVDDDLTDHTPTRVMGIAAGNEKPRQRLCHLHRSRFGAMAVQMS